MATAEPALRQRVRLPRPAAAARSRPLAAFRHDGVVARATPQYSVWPARYGRPFVYWFGPRPRLVLSDPELVKAAMTDSTGAFDKAGAGGNNPLARQLIGEGLVGLTGEAWARHRRVIAPAFNMERVKVRMRFLNLRHENW